MRRLRFPFSIFSFKRGSAPTRGQFGIDPAVSAALSVLDGVYALRRTEDMADILLTFENARVETLPGGSQRIVPGGDGGPLYLTAWFRPQHAQEQARVDSVPMTALPEGRMSGWSRIVVRRPADAATIAFTAADLLGALSDWPLALSTNGAVSDDPPLKTVSSFEALLSQQPGIGLAQIEAVAGALAMSSQAAAKRFPNDVSVAQGGSLSRKLKKEARRAADRALKGVSNRSPELRQAAEFHFIEGLTVFIPGVVMLLAGKPQPPGVRETALELPARLYMSPTSAERLRHRLFPFERHGRTELWHTRLSRKSSSRPEGAEEATRDAAAVRPIWTPDLLDNEAKAPEDSLVTGLFQTFLKADSLAWPMSGLDRSDLVHLGSNFDTVRQGDGAPWAPTPARVKRLELSALGGFLDLDAKWPGPLPVGVSLTAWRHRLSLGRDSTVEIVRAGVLAPFGHRAVEIVVTEREVEPLDSDFTEDEWSGKEIAILVQRKFLAVVEPLKAFEAGHLPQGGREFPLKTVEILTGQTQIQPKLDKGIWPRRLGDSDPLMFDVRATDHAGRPVRFSLPMAFFPIAEASAPSSEPQAQILVTKYGYTWADERYHADIGGQTVRLAEDNADKDSLSFTTERLSFDIAPWTGTLEGGIHRFRPRLAKARVLTPGAAEFAGGPKAVEVAYYGTYLKSGFDATQNEGEVVLSLTSPLSLFDSASGASTEKAGPVATPRVAIHGLSRRLGAVTGPLIPLAAEAGESSKALSEACAGTFDPATLLPEMKLLGAFDLKDLLSPMTLPPLTDGSGDETTPGRAMRLKRDIAPDGSTRASLIFVQPLTSFDVPGTAGVLAFKSAGAQLDMRAVTTTPAGGEGVQSLDASVSNFAVNFFGVVELRFDRIAFAVKPGSKPDFDLILGSKPMAFIGKLSFLQQLADVLPASAFSDPPDLQITSSGVIAGYSLGLPPIQVGALALSNIGFGARFELPFLGGAPTLRLNFAERHSPFGILVAFLGGGGFFAVEFDTKGLKAIEGTLEAQAGIAINLGVAAGAVLARLGIYYRWDVQKAGGTMTLEAFAEIRGEMSVLGLISVSITFHVGLEYEVAGDQKWLAGRASITVEIELLFFSKSVSVECERRFLGCDGDPSFEEMFKRLPDELVAADVPPDALAAVSPKFAAYASAFE